MGLESFFKARTSFLSLGTSKAYIINKSRKLKAFPCFSVRALSILSFYADADANTESL